YLDYRYYETRYADMAKENKTDADEWYNSNEGVLYPFGYGLSYTTFSQEIIRVKPMVNSVLTEETDVIEVSVKVTNTGDVAGKDAVQLYWKAPYTAGGIEKADHVLCAFDKTNIIQPGESEVRHLTFHLQDVANYDYKDANNNGHKGYELDDGNYAIMVMKNAHEAYGAEMPLKVKDGGIIYETDRFTGHEVTNRFTDRGFYSSMPGEDDIEFTEMSREDFEGTFPTYPTFEDRKVKSGSRYEEFLTHEYDLSAFEEGRDYEYTPEGAHRTAADGANWKQTGKHTIKLIEMKDCEPDDPKWDEFINEFSWSELMTYVETNKMSSPAMSSIGKSNASEGDGPQKFNIMAWVSSPIIAATFNQRLAHEQGECVGMESQISGKSGWWGCAVNTHRSPFGGRNFEYYSADPFLMGRMAAQVVGAATDRGVYAYFKHFAVNDQEKNRESGISFVNEQALREIYLKSFQMVFEEGKSIGVMGSYNRLGLLETAASYPLMTEVLRGEWGFKGSVLSDMTHSGNGSVNFKCYENVTWRVLAGCNCQLDSNGFSGQVSQQAKWDANANEGKGAPVCVGGQKQIAWSLWNACREAVKQHMYMSVNSTVAQRGLTQVVGQTDAVINVNDNVNIDVVDDLDAKEIYEGAIVPVYGSDNSRSTKEIETIDSYEINKRCDLPKGITFEDGVISGKFENVQLARIDVVVNVTLAGGAKAKIAYKYVLDVVPNLDDEYKVESGETITPDPEDPPVIIKPEEKGCGGSVVAASAIVSVLAIAGASLLLLKKKKEELN
nr:fibronectin type III-like domain-contianing protein [Bacilli bacterium]